MPFHINITANAEQVISTHITIVIMLIIVFLTITGVLEFQKWFVLLSIILNNSAMLTTVQYDSIGMQEVCTMCLQITLVALLSLTVVA